MSPTGDQSAPPREGIITEAERYVKQMAALRLNDEIFSGRHCRGVSWFPVANSLQAGTQIFGIDSRGIADGAKVLIVLEQELFCFALGAERAADPFFHGAGDYRAP